jgi:hypothetical protein
MCAGRSVGTQCDQTINGNRIDVMHKQWVTCCEQALCDCPTHVAEADETSEWCHYFPVERNIILIHRILGGGSRRVNGLP